MLAGTVGRSHAADQPSDEAAAAALLASDKDLNEHAYAVASVADALARNQGPVLAYCRSGTRSTLLWSLAEASRGRNVDDIATAAACGGYDVAPIRQLMDMLAARS